MTTQGDKVAPEGSLLSPLLCNIYLHELDVFMDSLIMHYNKGKERARNKEYVRLINLKRRKGLTKKELKELNKAAKRLPSKDMHDPNYIRLNYVRYANDLLIGVISDKQTANTIHDKVIQFLQDELSIKIQKSSSSLTHSTNV